MPQMAVGSDHTPFIVPSGRLEQLRGELEGVGVKLAHRVSCDGALTAGIALSVDALAVYKSVAAATLFKEQLFDALTNGCELLVSMLRLHRNNAKEPASGVFAAVCECIRDVALELGVSSAAIGIAVDISAMSPQAAWSLRCEILGAGPLFVLPDRALMCPSNSPAKSQRHERFWLQMWHLRRTSRLRPAYAPLVSSQCPLLSDEAAHSVLPTTAIQVPAGSAWLSLHLDISRFASGSDSVRSSALQHALCRAVEIGEQLHELVTWPNAHMRHDAWLNRRLAIIVSGFGDLLRMRALDPCEFIALQDLSATLRWIQEVLLQQSQRIAARNGVLPALQQADPSHAIPGEQVRKVWRERWQLAMDLAAIRHRNMLVLSPWSVFPAGRPADIRYANLLPLLSIADACSFSAAPDLGNWNVSQFKSFHRRAWAVIQQREFTHQIAERI